MRSLYPVTLRCGHLTNLTSVRVITGLGGRACYPSKSLFQSQNDFFTKNVHMTSITR